MIIIDILKFIFENTIFFLIKFFEAFGYAAKIIYSLIKYFYLGIYQIFYTIMINLYKLSEPLLDFISNFFSKIFKHELNGMNLVLKNRTFQTCFSGFLIFLGSLLIVSDVYGSYTETKYDTEELDSFFKNNMVETEKIPDIKVLDENIEVDNTKTYNINDYVNFSNYFAAIEIPSIDVKQGIKKDNGTNAVINIAVTSLLSSDNPNINNGNFTLAGHSGNGNKSYFKNLNKLKVNDMIIIYFDSKKYYYKIYDIYEVHETNLSPLERVLDKTIVTLITCKSSDNQYRIIVRAELVSTEQYIYE